MPMNHWYNEADGKIYFHCGKSGHRLDALRKCNKVSFCTYDRGYCEYGDWALHVKSVIVFGTIAIVEDMETIADISRKLSYKFTQDEEYIQNEIDKYAKATLLLRLTPEHICGKQITES
jgi:nitroimidazol reductase NimA-like FMN-containing flavoprotein (pyridoxamine 5'-phosphate oxidase superfamily)